MLRSGQVAGAEAACRPLLTSSAGRHDVHALWSLVAYHKGEFDEAAKSLERAMALAPDRPGYFNNLSIVRLAQGRPTDAEEAARRALALRLNYPEAENNLGNALRAQGRLEEASLSFKRALLQRSGLVEAAYGLGLTLQAQGHLEEAGDAYRRLLAIRPDHVEALYRLGNMLLEQGETSNAAVAYRKVLTLRPSHAEAAYNLGTAFQAEARLEEAREAYSMALSIRSDFAKAANNLAGILLSQGRQDEAIETYHRALTIQTERDPRMDSNLLFAEHYRAGVTLAGLAQEHARWDRNHAVPQMKSWRRFENEADPERPLRLGFLSPDFRHHPVATFFIGVLKGLQTEECESFCYSDVVVEDSMTERIVAESGDWYRTRDLDDHQLAGKIYDDRIDILFDLAGHTGGNRLLTFARKPAPIQATWNGYVGTTGLGAMDYLIADRFTVPEGAERHYREQILRLPHSHLCFDPPHHSPPVGPLPALSRGFVTFGSFNNPAKITPFVVAAWAEILLGVPQSRMLLKYRGLADAGTRRLIETSFEAHGVCRSRLEMVDFSSTKEEGLTHYNKIDLALDTFPFGGCTTTCEAFWMGVPVISCHGETFASRFGLSFSSTVGLCGTSARDTKEYVKMAVDWANDLARLEACRSTLRGRLVSSPLCDGHGFAKDLMAILRELWRRWCAADSARAGPSRLEAGRYESRPKSRTNSGKEELSYGWSKDKSSEPLWSPR